MENSLNNAQATCQRQEN